MADEELEELQSIARSITEQDRQRHTPPPHVWSNIEATIADPNTAGKSAGKTELTSDDPTPTIEHTSDTADNVHELSSVRPEHAFERPRARTSRSRLLLAGIAAAIALIAGITLFDGSASNIPTFVAEASNTTLTEDFGGTATAIVEVDDVPMLELDFSEPIPDGEPVELWLGTDDFSELVSLGNVRPGATSWSGDWPTGVDPTVFRVVDLSIEPDDGNDDHSGRSILRGELRPI